MKLAHRPDILDCIAHLSSDEVMTPPVLANAMLDLLPPEVWSDPDLKWLDPFCKSGVFLREIAKRLLVGLAAAVPKEPERLEHIYKKMLFGTATSALSAEMARRTVYCSRDASGGASVVRFAKAEGNLPFIQTQHDFKGKPPRCKTCGAPAGIERGLDRENYAYSFIHGTYPTEELKDVKFDVIVGNPPYQISADGTTRTIPVYQHFVDQAIALDPRYIVMITPSRWFAGGLGLDEFRDRMIGDRRLVKIVDNPKLFDCFPGVEIKGGVSYFLWDRDHNGDCEFSVRLDGKIVSTVIRDIREGHGVLIRDNRAAAIVHQVREQAAHFVSEGVRPRLAFNEAFRTNFRGAPEPTGSATIPIIYNSGVGYVSLDGIERNQELVSRWKVLVPKAGDGHGREISYVLGEPIALAPGSVCTETYFVAGDFDKKAEAENFAYYLTTKFARFLLLQRKVTQDLTPDRFLFVPTVDLSRRWSDEDLYAKFGLSDEDAAYIEATIHPREPYLSLDSPIPASHLPGGHKYRTAVDEVDDEDEEA